MGNEVYFIFGAEALVALARSSFGIERLGDINSALTLLTESKSLGAKVWACESVVALCHLNASELVLNKTVHEVVGLAQIWRISDGATTYFF
jgi:predicted peroxiredoxin